MADATAQPGTNSGSIIFELVDKTVSGADKANTFVLNPISAAEAFRKYDWLVGSPVMNSTGDLRGMVINSQMRAVYTISGKVADRLAVVSALIEIGREMSRIKAVYGSNEDGMEKTSRILLLGSAAILRSVTGVVPTAVQLACLSAGGYAQLYSLLTGSSAGNELSNRLQQAGDWVETTHRKQWDGQNWYNFINSTLN